MPLSFSSLAPLIVSLLALYSCRNGYSIGRSAHGVIQRFADLLEEETDFLMEAEHTLYFEHLLQNCQKRDPSLFQQLHIPSVMVSASREDILIMEYIDGIPILDTAGTLKVSLWLEFV